MTANWSLIETTASHFRLTIPLISASSNLERASTSRMNPASRSLNCSRDATSSIATAAPPADAPEGGEASDKAGDVGDRGAALAISDANSWAKVTPCWLWRDGDLSAAARRASDWPAGAAARRECETLLDGERGKELVGLAVPQRWHDDRLAKLEEHEQTGQNQSAAKPLPLPVALSPFVTSFELARPQSRHLRRWPAFGALQPSDSHWSIGLPDFSSGVRPQARN